MCLAITSDTNGPPDAARSWKEGIMPKTVDPVCGMELDPGQIEAQSQYQGKAYSFCSTECKRLFDADPEKYVGASASQAQESPPTGAS
jgi:YHS domain-containing protein